MAYLRGRGDWQANRERRFGGVANSSVRPARPASSDAVSFVQERRFRPGEDVVSTGSYRPVVVEDAPGGYVVREYDTFTRYKSKKARSKDVYLKSETFYDLDGNLVRTKRWRNDDGNIGLQLERDYQTGQGSYFSRTPNEPLGVARAPETYEEARRLQLAQQQRQRFTDRPSATQYRGQTYRAGTTEYFEGREATRRFQEYSALSDQGYRVGDLAPARVQPVMTPYGGFNTAYGPRQDNLQVRTDIRAETETVRPGYFTPGYSQTFLTREEGFSGRLPQQRRSYIQERLVGERPRDYFEYAPGFGEFALRRTEASPLVVTKSRIGSVWDRWNVEAAERQERATWRTNVPETLARESLIKLEGFSNRVVKNTTPVSGFNLPTVTRMFYGAVAKSSRYVRERPVSFATVSAATPVAGQSRWLLGGYVGVTSGQMYAAGRRGSTPEKYQTFLSDPRSEKIINSEYAGVEPGIALWNPKQARRVVDWFTLRVYRQNVAKNLRKEGYSETDIPLLTEATVYEKRTRQGAGAAAVIGGEIAGNLVGGYGVQRAGPLLSRFARYRSLTPRMRKSVKFSLGTGVGGIAEGSTASISLDIAERRPISVKRAAVAGGFGFFTAGSLGAVYGFGAATPGLRGRVIRGAVYPFDQPQEEAGDLITAGLLRQTRRRAPVATPSVSRSATRSPIVDVSFSEVGRTALAPVRPRGIAPAFGFARVRSFEQSNRFALAKNNAQTDAISRLLSRSPARSNVPNQVMTRNFVFTGVPTRTPTRSIVPSAVPTRINTRINTRIDARTVTEVPVVVPTGKAFMPFLLGGWPMGGRRRKTKRQYQYAPELSSLFFGVKAKKAPRTPRGGWTGFEIRPVVT